MGRTRVARAAMPSHDRLERDEMIDIKHDALYESVIHVSRRRNKESPR